MQILIQYSGMKLESSNKLPGDTNIAGTQTKLRVAKLYITGSQTLLHLVKEL